MSSAGADSRHSVGKRDAGPSTRPPRSTSPGTRIQPLTPSVWPVPRAGTTAAIPHSLQEIGTDQLMINVRHSRRSDSAVMAELNVPYFSAGTVPHEALLSEGSH